MIKRSSKPSKQVNAAVKEANIEVKTGSFNEEEDEIIRKNWESFLKVIKNNTCLTQKLIFLIFILGIQIRNSSSVYVQVSVEDEA